MVKAFIDTNVLLDLVLENRPENPIANQLFSAEAPVISNAVFLLKVS